VRGKFVRRQKPNPIDVTVLAEELTRSCRSLAELEALVGICAREHRLDTQDEDQLRALAEAAMHRRIA
jgi:hypothetical protein